MDGISKGTDDLSLSRMLLKVRSTVMKIDSQIRKVKRREKSQNGLRGRRELRASNYLSNPKGHMHVTTAQSRVHTKRALGAGEGLRRISSTSVPELEHARSLSNIYDGMTDPDKEMTASRHRLHHQEISKEQTRPAHMSSMSIDPTHAN